MKVILVLKDGVELVDFGARVYYCAKQSKNEFALYKIISMESKKFLVLCKA